MAQEGTASAFADLADLITSVGRELHALQSTADDVVPLTGTEALVLRHVDRHPGTSPSATAVATGLHRSNLSTVLRTLESRGLVERTSGAHDGRSVALRSSAKAAATVTRLRRHWDRHLRSALGHDDGGDGDTGEGAGSVRAAGAEEEVLRAVQLLRRLEAGLALQRAEPRS